MSVSQSQSPVCDWDGWDQGVLGETNQSSDWNRFMGRHGLCKIIQIMQYNRCLSMYRILIIRFEKEIGEWRLNEWLKQEASC